jgi:hypothetical protein
MGECVPETVTGAARPPGVYGRCAVALGDQQGGRGLGAAFPLNPRPNSRRGGVQAGRKGYDGSVLRRRLVLPPEEWAELRQSTRSLGGRLALGGLAALVG